MAAAECARRSCALPGLPRAIAAGAAGWVGSLRRRYLTTLQKSSASSSRSASTPACWESCRRKSFPCQGQTPVEPRSTETSRRVTVPQGLPEKTTATSAASNGVFPARQGPRRSMSARTSSAATMRCRSSRLAWHSAVATKASRVTTRMSALAATATTAAMTDRRCAAFFTGARALACARSSSTSSLPVLRSSSESKSRPVSSTAKRS
mmetsp:Transcript_11716/g.40482  ORF Transcript_11716/g.40482 Transcript_11716/m.40482 type:complete len:208 (+) Transcript_11716:196-819(+)